MKIVVDTGPIVASVNRRDVAHKLAADIATEHRRELFIPTTVLAEADHLLRSRVSPDAARAFLSDVRSGVYSVAFLTPELVRRAVDIDARYADLDLGFTDATVMAYAERHGLPILTFDFEGFRATRPERGFWRLVVDEARYADATKPRNT